MNIIGTLDNLTSGEYLFEGERVDDFKPEKLAELRNKRIGFIFQSFNLLPRLSVAKNIERPMMYGQIPKPQRRLRIEEVLDKVGLLEKKDAMPLELSGGQQQRVAIARALVMTPALILADEPTGALDSKTSAKVMSELQQINRDTQTTMILVTHDEKTASYAHRIIKVQDGLINNAD
jgi:putative ABC transport system ATP-binding protein